MHRRVTAIGTVVLVALTSLGIAACGSASSTSSSPSTLLSQTFTGKHKVSSGVLKFTFTVDPSGSSVLNGPITLSFGGPFQTRGSGQLPESDFTIDASALGRSVSVGILSTGTSGYVTLQGASYQLPPATFQKLESSFAQAASSAGTSKNSGTLAKFGIHPLRWLTHPTIVGTETVGGAETTHIHAGVSVPALLGDLNTLLAKASSVNVSGASALKSGIPPAVRDKIAAAIHNPSVDVWTGTSDKTIRRLSIALTVPVTGNASSQLGGLRSADIGLTLQYSNLNQPQKITAPTTVRPFSEFQQKVAAFVRGLQGAASGVLGNSGGASSGGSSPGGGSSSASTTKKVQNYSHCIQQAGGDVAKMQKCASLLSSGSGG